MTLPEKFEVDDLVIFTTEKRKQQWFWGASTGLSGLKIVTEVNWRIEGIKINNENAYWYSFLDFTIVKKACPIVKLVI